VGLPSSFQWGSGGSDRPGVRAHVIVERASSRHARRELNAA
jgi:hypothetical protein